jgi:RHH-type proline utilization regulon transcriptional repressor/proline dehydrogenase/delta 1-pyrroline-5-carboxylate dehydrogenase
MHAAAPSPPFTDFTAGLDTPPSPLRAAIAAATRMPETQAVPPLLEQARLPPDAARAAGELALRLARSLRDRPDAGGRAGLVQGLLQEYALSSQEGVALMCMAEALLRIPDAATRDALIRDKIAHGQWEAHLGRSRSPFVNAATWGLLVTGKLVSTHSESGLSAALARLVGLGGEPLIRKGVDLAMRMMGEQFVAGQTIEQALANARGRESEGFRHSFDMLGEAALTADDAARYRRAYEHAIDAIAAASGGRGIHAGPGISIKLSALHPRYARAQYERVTAELYPVLRELALRARDHDIGFNIDAEEADRLELSLDLLERLCFEPGLAAWDGIGFVVQAYQKRCPFVVDHLLDLARRSGHRLMIRLVKGAYWDSEIKRAQVDGLDDYPVYTRKLHTDLCYLACARKLLAAPDAAYPQFATHNAHTVAAVHQLAGPDRYWPGQYEFQCLHGMGEPLYEQIVGGAPGVGGMPGAGGASGRPCRIYAPVGTHETLLAYLVRRLLENGANTSFVHRIADRSVPVDELVQDPVQAVEQLARHEGALGKPHPAIVLPHALYGADRVNSRGLDLASDRQLAQLRDALRASTAEPWRAAPLLAVDARIAVAVPVRNPADHRDVVGHVQEAASADVDAALREASAFAPAWATTAPAERAAALERAADELERTMPRLMGLLIREAGKTCANAIVEVREATDFLRYYAAQVRREFANDTHRPLGPVACISPWNFPLAIFTGQVAAALAAGNTVLAKSAEQTPLIAAEAVRTLWRAGVPRGALQLLPGGGETTGAQLVGDARIRGVLFTGSTEVARVIERAIAGRLDAHGHPAPLVAETGGQNAMIVDSSALPEQVVSDVIVSAFDSAGQRCSALRVLCVQEEVAERVITMLRGAMDELHVGNPDRLAVDVGPVIDAGARAALARHIDAMRDKGRDVYQAHARGYAEAARHGTFVPPTLIVLKGIEELEREVFGPVLHVVRYRRAELDALLARIDATGYGLTLGLHTRIDETIARVVERARAGNVYVNRNMVGAVVGVQPFGGEGLSGTGPKAGGPLYLYRLLSRRPADAVSRALPARGTSVAAPLDATPLNTLRDWAHAEGRTVLAALCDRYAAQARTGWSQDLPGPTGERNVYRLVSRRATLCLADDDTDRLVQLVAVLAVGSRAVWPPTAAALHRMLPAAVQARIALDENAAPDAVLFHGSASALAALCRRIAQREGPIVAVQGLAPGDTGIRLERLVVERVVSINTAAAGGNATLMTIG